RLRPCRRRGRCRLTRQQPETAVRDRDEVRQAVPRLEVVSWMAHRPSAWAALRCEPTMGDSGLDHVGKTKRGKAPGSWPSPIALASLSPYGLQALRLMKSRLSTRLSTPASPSNSQSA